MIGLRIVPAIMHVAPVEEILPVESCEPPIIGLGRLQLKNRTESRIFKDFSRTFTSGCPPSRKLDSVGGRKVEDVIAKEKLTFLLTSNCIDSVNSESNCRLFPDSSLTVRT